MQAERVRNIEHLLRGILDALLSLLSGRIGADVDVVAANADLLAVALVRDAVDLLEVVRVRDDLVAGDDVLADRGHSVLAKRHSGTIRSHFLTSKAHYWTYRVDNHFEYGSAWSGEGRAKMISKRRPQRKKGGLG